MFYSMLEPTTAFIWKLVPASFHEVSEVLIVLSPSVLISAWNMRPSFLLLRLERSVSHRCSCVDPISTRGWQLIFIKAAVGEAETWGISKGCILLLWRFSPTYLSGLLGGDMGLLRSISCAATVRYSICYTAWWCASTGNDLFLFILCTCPLPQYSKHGFHRFFLFHQLETTWWVLK